ncbi:Fc.00g019170.m01.CDS01 [Cosmosporella sp. VM-42]
MDLVTDGGCQGHKRFFLVIGAQLMQMSGIKIVSYYAPTLFQNILGISQERALFVGGFLQVWYLSASSLTWWLIEAVGRPHLFVSMAFSMAVFLIAEAICIENGEYRAGIAAVALVYPAEILPLKLRAKGTSLAAAADYLRNFLVVEFTPPALDNIGYKTYIIFAVLNITSAIVCWSLHPETAGLSLESTDTLFIRQLDDEGIKASRPWYHKYQWSVIARSKVAVHKAKEQHRLERKTANGDVEIVQKEDLGPINQREKDTAAHLEKSGPS